MIIRCGYCRKEFVADKKNQRFCRDKCRFDDWNEKHPRIGKQLAGRSKYGAKQQATSDGKVMASKREARRYEQLLQLQGLGLISNLRTEVKYELVPKQKGERAVTYTADFAYEDPLGKTHVEDAKGAKTQQYVIRRKLMLYFYGIKIEEV